MRQKSNFELRKIWTQPKWFLRICYSLLLTVPQIIGFFLRIRACYSYPCVFKNQYYFFYSLQLCTSSYHLHFLDMRNNSGNRYCIKYNNIKNITFESAG